MSLDQSDIQKPRVLVAGPVRDSGGMAQVARQTANGTLFPNWQIAVADTSRRTRTDRSVMKALWAHAQRFGGLVKSLIRYRPQVTHIHTCSYMTFYRSMPDILVSVLAGSKVVLHVHGGFFDQFIESRSPMMRWLISWHLRRCSAVLVLGEVWRKRLSQLVPGPEYRVLMNGVSLPSSIRTKTSSSGKVRFLFAGDLSEAKGFGDLLDAISQLDPEVRKKAVFRLAGTGDAEALKLWQTMVEKRGIQPVVQFTGQLSGEQMNNEFEEADVFLLPSRGEGLPLALLEAMSHGLPSIITDVGAIREVFRDGIDGLLIPPRQIPRLRDAITKMIAIDSFRAACSREAFKQYKTNLTQECFASNLHEIYSSLIPSIHTCQPLNA